MVLFKNILDELEDFSYNNEKIFKDFIKDKYFYVVFKKKDMKMKE